MCPGAGAKVDALTSPPLLGGVVSVARRLPSKNLPHHRKPTKTLRFTFSKPTNAGNLPNNTSNANEGIEFRRPRVTRPDFLCQRHHFYYPRNRLRG